MSPAGEGFTERVPISYGKTQCVKMPICKVQYSFLKVRKHIVAHRCQNCSTLLIRLPAHTLLQMSTIWCLFGAGLCYCGRREELRRHLALLCWQYDMLLFSHHRQQYKEDTVKCCFGPLSPATNFVLFIFIFIVSIYFNQSHQGYYLSFKNMLWSPQAQLCTKWFCVIQNVICNNTSLLPPK